MRGGKEAPEAVPYVLCYTRPPFPKPQPSLAPARHPSGLTMLWSPVLADVKELSRQVKRAVGVPLAPALPACCSSLVCGCPPQLTDGSVTLLGSDCLVSNVWQRGEWRTSNPKAQPPSPLTVRTHTRSGALFLPHAMLPTPPPSCHLEGASLP